MENYLYHGSIIPNIRELETKSILHNTHEPVLYLTSNIPYALVYIWDSKKNHYERKHVTCGIRNGEVFYEEKFPNQLETFYKNVSGFLYCVTDNETDVVKDREYMYYSKKNKIVEKTIFIKDVYEELLKFEALGEFKIYRYNEQTEEMKKELNELTAYYLIKTDMLKDDDEQANFYQMYYNTSWEIAIQKKDDVSFLKEVEDKYLCR